MSSPTRETHSSRKNTGKNSESKNKQVGRHGGRGVEKAKDKSKSSTDNSAYGSFSNITRSSRVRMSKEQISNFKERIIAECRLAEKGNHKTKGDHTENLLKIVNGLKGDSMARTVLAVKSNKDAKDWREGKGNSAYRNIKSLVSFGSGAATGTGAGGFALSLSGRILSYSTLSFQACSFVSLVPASVAAVVTGYLFWKLTDNITDYLAARYMDNKSQNQLNEILSGDPEQDLEDVLNGLKDSNPEAYDQVVSLLRDKEKAEDIESEDVNMSEDESNGD